MPKVWNKRDKDAPKEAVYVGRPTKWGNPFGFLGVNSNITMACVTTRDEALRCFEAYLQGKPELLQAVRTELKGKDLVCWCAPKPCHADILLEIANAKTEEPKT